MTKIANPIGRSSKEWIGKTADSMPPPRVRLRIFERAGGVCHISGRKIEPGDLWDVEHVVRLADGGENRESNLRPALRDKHLVKTAAENAAGAIVRKKRGKHIGAKTAPVQKIPSAPMPISERTAARKASPKLPVNGMTQLQRAYLKGLNQ